MARKLSRERMWTQKSSITACVLNLHSRATDSRNRKPDFSELRLTVFIYPFISFFEGLLCGRPFEGTGDHGYCDIPLEETNQPGNE